MFNIVTLCLLAYTEELNISPTMAAVILVCLKILYCVLFSNVSVQALVSGGGGLGLPGTFSFFICLSSTNTNGKSFPLGVSANIYDIAPHHSSIVVG